MFAIAVSTAAVEEVVGFEKEYRVSFPSANKTVANVFFKISTSQTTRLVGDLNDKDHSDRISSGNAVKLLMPVDSFKTAQ